MAETTEFSGFPRGAPGFLARLAENNAKPWFDRHRGEFEELLLAPARAAVAALGARLKTHAPGIRAEPRINGSIMRINRDTRFAKNKAPYKDYLGLWFWEGEGPSRACPGFYFGFGAKSLTIGAGMHRFGPDHLARYRPAVVDPDHGPALGRIVDALSAGELGGRHYKRVPRGFDPDHRNAALLLHNGLTAGRTEALPEALFGPGAAEYCAAAFSRYAPLHRWLVGALAP